MLITILNILEVQFYIQTNHQTCYSYFNGKVPGPAMFAVTEGAQL